MAQLPGGVPFIRFSDLQDQTETVLNNVISQIFSLLPSSTTASTWTSYAPQFAGAGLTLDSFVANEALYQHFNYMVLLNVDVVFAVSAGSGTTFTVTYPASFPPASTSSYGDVLNCVLLIGGSEVAAIARVTNGSILVQRADGAAFTSGTIEVLLSGFYRTSS